MFLGQRVWQDMPFDRRAGPGWFLLVGALLFLLGVLVFQSETISPKLEKILEKIALWLRVRPWQVLLLGLSLPVSFLVPLAAGIGPKMVSPGPAVTAWLLGLALVIAGGLGVQFKILRPEKTTLIWATGLVVVAFLLRAVATDSIPITLTGDEGSAGINAANFKNGDSNNIFIAGWFSFPALFFFTQSLAIQLLGQTTQALRIPSALAGALTVLAVYLVGKKVFNQRIGVIAALFLAALHFHIHFSRIGLNNIWDGLWYVVVVGALWVGWQDEDRHAYLLAGMGLGFSQYFYPSSRTLFALLLAGSILAALYNRPRLRRALPHILVMLLTAFVIVLPLAWFYAKNPDEYMAPLMRVSILGDWLTHQVQASGLPAWKILSTQILTGFKAYTYTPLLAWYKPDSPILRPLAAALFYAGLILLAVRYRDSRLVLLVLWLGAIGLVGGLSESTPAAQRYVAAAPACALVLAVGLDGSAGILSSLWPKVTKPVSALVFVLLAVVIAGDLKFYFVDYMNYSVIENTRSNGMIAQRLANDLKDKTSDTQVVFFGAPLMGYYSIPSTAYLTPQVKGIDINEPWSSSKKGDLTGDELIFVFLSNHEDEIEAVQADYPEGALKTEYAWNGEILFWLYEANGSQ